MASAQLPSVWPAMSHCAPECQSRSAILASAWTCRDELPRAGPRPGSPISGGAAKRSQGNLRKTKDLPLICMHGHVEPEVFADDVPFADPAQLLIVPDHYVFRMLASQGIEPARLGVPRLDGGPVESDSRNIWRTFCENWKLFRGTPSRYWLEHELVEVFSVDLVPSAETADAIYDQIAACVADPQFRPRALLDRFNIEVISTTDSATSDLQHHAKLAADGLGERVFPTFRPDAVAYLDRPTWRTNIAGLAQVWGIDTTSYDGFLDALRSRRAAFVEAGARATDHGH